MALEGGRMAAGLLDDVLELKALLRPAWADVSAGISAWHPRCEGDDDAGDDAGADDDAKDGDAGADDADDSDDATADAGKGAAGKTADDYRKELRRYERTAKTSSAKKDAEIAELRKKLEEREDAEASDHEKALKAAREEERAAVTAKYEETQRADRIENAVTGLSLKGFKAKVDDKDVTLRFADPDDAQLRVDRALRVGDLAYEDIYVDGRVDRAAVTVFLTEVLEEHPRLRADDGNGAGKQQRVDFDGGKGKGAGGKALEDMDPEEHYQQVVGKRGSA